MYAMYLTLQLFLGISVVRAAFDKTSNSGLAVYWGQNSLNGDQSQLTLLEYCKEGSNIDTFILAFVVDPMNGKLNFANAKCEDEISSPMKCTLIGQDIKSCQRNYKKTILLSIGGASGSVSFDSVEEAKRNAESLWNMFGDSNSSSNGARPFGDAVVDGFDIDVESSSTAYLSDWARRLKELIGGERIITAAPQCPTPALNPLNDLLESETLDAVFVQFYNNLECSPGSSQYTRAQWQQFALEKSIKYFMGLPAGPSAGSNGYLEVADMQQYVSEAKTDSNFGGVMLWDASQAWANSNYQDQVATTLGRIGTYS